MKVSLSPLCRTEADSTVGEHTSRSSSTRLTDSFRSSMLELGRGKKLVSDSKILAAKKQEELISVLQHQNTRIEQLSVCLTYLFIFLRHPSISLSLIDWTSISHTLLLSLKQEAAQGSYSPVNVGFSLRVPKTQINLSGSHQNGKGSVMVSHVPDESAHLVGQSGFSSVHSGDLGITIGGAI